LKLKGPTMAKDQPMFELARFAWGAPDRLELSGKFIGLPELPDEPPTLVINGEDGVHRLPVVGGSRSGPPRDGQRWDVVFAWQEPPVALASAELEIGRDIVVELPEPAAKRTRPRRQTLSVSRERAPEADAADDERPEPPVQQLRAQAELLSVQEALRQTVASLERSDEEVARLRDELAAERELRRADRQRFDEALGSLSDAAEQAVAEELSEARQTIEEREASLEELRVLLEAAGAIRAEAESEARAEIEALREQVSALAQEREESDQMRAELDQARSALDDVRGDIQRLLGRLPAIDHAGSDGA
jgi:hypothetical protein